MDFQIIEDRIFDQLFSLLSESVPEFITVFDKEDGIYPLLGEFGRFIINHQDNPELMISCFNFINTALEKGGSSTQDALITQVFEQFYLDDKTSVLAHKLLNIHAKELFDKNQLHKI